MKRLIPSAVLAVIILLGCIWGHYVTDDVCNITDTELKECEQAYKNGSFDKAQELAKKLQKEWEDREEKLSLFVNHSFLDEISENLAQIPYFANPQSANLGLAKISYTKHLLKHIEEHQSLIPESFY